MVRSSFTTITRHDSSLKSASDNAVEESERLLEKKLLRKLDARMSILVLMYTLNSIDRSNVASARVQGFEEDLGLKGAEYPTLLSIFCVGYILPLLPSNMLLNHIKRPSIYLPSCAIAWGTICISSGFTKNFTGMLLCRFFLGCVESSFFPGALLTLSAWYTRDELGLRSGMLLCGTIIGSTFGTFMTSGILGGMDGMLNQPAWRWLFWIDGSLTVACAIPAMFILPDFPAHPSVRKWLASDELALALRRKGDEISNQATQGNHGQLAGLSLALRDWKVWWLASTMIPFHIATSYHSFFPTLTQTLGYRPVITLLLCTPPAFAAAIYSLVISWHSDRIKRRLPHILASMIMALIGYTISMCTMNKGARYFSIFLMQFTFSAHVCLLAWISSSFPHDSAKRAVALGMIAGSSQLGGVAASYVFPRQWGPQYINSFGISFAGNVLTILMCLIYKVNSSSLDEKLEKEHAKKEEVRA